MPAFAVNTTEPPAQKVVADPAVIVAVGNGFTVAVTAVLVADTQPVVVFLDCA